ncbi:hypothetical protein [Niveibacterium sp. COAC-50]|uniref:hypothetical protein n=1 Tax=Niveibacterium sp. COAC-50 TaxID=2729384 RepID=UPI001555547A|nr:hypothetical protein [Niveibacterium sp. COAC-50]
MSDTTHPANEPSLDALRQRALELEAQLGAAIPNFCDKRYVERKASEHPHPDPDVRLRAALIALCGYYESLIALRERDSATWNAIASWN